MMQRWLAGACVALVLVLGGCGGGGSGGAAPGATGSGGGTSTATGLVPGAPATGATLFADASVLGPLRDGAVWNYRGAATAYVGATPLQYTTATTHAAASATTVTESQSNSDNTGADSQQLSASNGTISTPQSVDLSGKGAETVQLIELRSPVRLGDQYTSPDHRYTDTPIPTSTPTATTSPMLWTWRSNSSVIGTETPSLPNLPSLSTLRVDTTLLTRVIYSSNGQASPTLRLDEQTWYAAGIGILRQTTASPTASGNDNQTTDEQIVSWDGVTTGFGAMAGRNALIPTTSAEFAGQSVPGVWIYGAAALADRVLVVTPTPVAVRAVPTGALVSRLDLRGNVVSAHGYPTLLAQEGIFAGHAGGIIHLRAQITGSSSLPTLELTRFDADGALVGGIAGATIDLTGGHPNAQHQSFDAAIDGSTLWVFWNRLYPVAGGSAFEAVLRSCSLDGTPLGAEIVVDPTQNDHPRIAGSRRPGAVDVGPHQRRL